MPIPITPQGPTYNRLNAVGNPLTFDAAIELCGEKPEAAFAFQANYPVWAGSMQMATFEKLEEFISLIADPYGVTDGHLMLTHQDARVHIGWDCDKGFTLDGLVGHAAVECVARALVSPPEADLPYKEFNS